MVFCLRSQRNRKKKLPNLSAAAAPALVGVIVVVVNDVDAAVVVAVGGGGARLEAEEDPAGGGRRRGRRLERQGFLSLSSEAQAFFSRGGQRDRVKERERRRSRRDMSFFSSFSKTRERFDATPQSSSCLREVPLPPFVHSRACSPLPLRSLRIVPLSTRSAR